ncbi:MAG: NUDIX hydrolase [Anaerolineales bacterium]|nr:NUDIX hydrolase [Chloroflexota bacterium]MBL6982904.1 NUDIX hydrolase [Anaerolineales bacterium]
MSNTKNENVNADVIEAAGGLLWRDGPLGQEIAIVHRKRYDDWSIPKGKRDAGERWQETALREIKEETGCKAKIVNFAGSTAYIVGGVAKIVLFWNMVLKKDCTFTPNEEVDQLLWLSKKAAIKKLSYETEIDLLSNQNSF